MHAPSFWKDKTIFSTALLPAAALYNFFAGRRQAEKGTKVEVPVICVGNVLAGGSGKTPVALAIGKLLKERGKNPHYLTRGYKGRLEGPIRVSLTQHEARDVGDEPLLLAEVLPTWVARDRVAGAKAAIAAGADTVIMDDGFQNPSLVKDVSLLVIDGSYGFGNERLLPAGPLREPVHWAMERATAVICMGEDRHGVLGRVPAGKRILHAKIAPLPQALALAGLAVVAFAGIARPRKFQRTLQALGASVRHMVAYPDHHAFRPHDLAFLRAKAKEHAAQLVTTQKDYVRLPADMRAEVTAVPVEAVFEDEQALLTLALRTG